MLTDEQIAGVWQRQFALAKPYIEAGRIAPRSGKLPEMWPGYARSVNDRAKALPHIEPGHYADSLFLARAPNQSEEEFAYIKDNYKQTTLPVYADMENTIARVWSEGNWSLSFADERLRDYANAGVNEWGSVTNFMRYALPRMKISDPMGLLVILPRAVDTVIDADGNVSVDPDFIPEPEPVYHDCGDVWGFGYDKWYLIRLRDNSKLDDNGIGIKCWLIDDTNVWLIEQYGKQHEWTFRITVLYAHGCGEPPCTHLMGVPSIADGHLLWLSPFGAARELLDIALADAQYLQASKVKAVYPQRVIVGDACMYRDAETGALCVDGSLSYIEDDLVKTKPCPGCGGTGRASRLGPLNDLVITPSDKDGTQNLNAANALTYVSPSTDSVRFAREDIDKVTQEARSILHLGAEAPMAGGDAKTATQAGLDNRAKDAFVKTIADQIFEIFGLALKYTAAQRGATGEDAYTLRRPVVYDLRTLDDRLAEVNAARAAGLPFVTIAKMSDDAARSIFRHDATATDMIEATMQADRLALMPDAVIASELAAGRIAPWEMLLHYSAPALYAEVMGSSTTDLTISALATKMQAAAKAATGVEPPAPTPAARIGALLT